MAVARDDWSSARLVAAVALAGAWLAAIYAHFLNAPADAFADTSRVYISAGAAGLFAGWRHLGLRLGTSMAYAIAWGLGSAVLAGIYFGLLMGFRETLATYAFTHFGTAMELIDFLVDQSVEHFIEFLAPPTGFFVAIGSVAAGAIARTAHILWR